MSSNEKAHIEQKTLIISIRWLFHVTQQGKKGVCEVFTFRKFSVRNRSRETFYASTLTRLHASKNKRFPL